MMNKALFCLYSPLATRHSPLVRVTQSLHPLYKTGTAAAIEDGRKYTMSTLDIAGMVLLVIAGIILCLLFAALILVLLFGVPWQAYKRGNGFLSWFVLQLIAANPVYPMILVAMLPNRAKIRLRKQFARELDDKLDETVDRRSADIVLDGSPARSIGDLPTTGGSIEMNQRDGIARSLGDWETRAPDH